MNETSSANNKSGSGNNRRRRRRPSGNKPTPANNNAPRQNPPPQAAHNAGSNNPTKKSGSRSRRGGRARRRGNGSSQSTLPHLQGMDLVRAKYLSLVEKHVEARRKYYDFFHRADPNQLRKLEREFTDSQAQLLAYENSLSAAEREQLERDYGGKAEDRAYSTNHQISPQPREVPTEGEFEDPHVLESQKHANFSHDTEESVGTMEDYKRLKGLI